MAPCPPATSVSHTKFCTIPELLVIPAPLIVSSENVPAGSDVTLYALAPGSKTMLLASMKSERETAVKLETPKVAISDGPLGTVAGVQLAAVFQSPLAGSRFHVALPARLV